MKPSRDYQTELIKDLKNPKEAVGYLNAALETGDQKVFLLALRNVVEAQGSVTKLAKKTRLNRVSLYKITSSKGNPTIDSIIKIFASMGMKMKIEMQKKRGWARC